MANKKDGINSKYDLVADLLQPLSYEYKNGPGAQFYTAIILE